MSEPVPPVVVPAPEPGPQPVPQPVPQPEPEPQPGPQPEPEPEPQPPVIQPPVVVVPPFVQPPVVIEPPVIVQPPVFVQPPVVVPEPTTTVPIVRTIPTVQPSSIPPAARAPRATPTIVPVDGINSITDDSASSVPTSVVTAIIVIPIVLLILLVLSCFYIRSKRQRSRNRSMREFLAFSPQESSFKSGSITGDRDTSRNANLARSAGFTQRPSPPPPRTSWTKADLEQEGYGNIGSDYTSNYSNYGQPHFQQYETPAPAIYGTYYYQDENNLYIEDPFYGGNEVHYENVSPSIPHNDGNVMDGFLDLPVQEAPIDPRNTSQLESFAPYSESETSGTLSDNLQYITSSNPTSEPYTFCSDLESSSELSESLSKRDSILARTFSEGTLSKYSLPVVNSEKSGKVVINRGTGVMGYER